MLCLYFCFWFVSHFKVCDIISTGTCFGNSNQDFSVHKRMALDFAYSSASRMLGMKSGRTCRDVEV